MPKSSRHKSHKQSKHRDAREYSDSEEDAKMRDYNEEGSIRVSRNSGSSEKRKDPPGHCNGDVTGGYVGSKRRKEKEKGDVSGVSDRWNGGGGTAALVENEIKGESSRIDDEKTLKSKSGVDSKSKSSRAHDSGGEKKEVSKDGSKVESKRKYEKESGRKEAQQNKDLKESKEKDKVVEKEKERKVKDSEQEGEDEVVDIGDSVAPLAGFGEKQDGRHDRENNAWPVQNERNPKSEKELEKQRSKRDGSNEKDKYQDDEKGRGDGRVSSRGERGKDGKYKDEKHKDGSHADMHNEDGNREFRYKDEKYVEDVDRDRRYRDSKYRGSSEKVNTHKDDKYREHVDRDKRLRNDKYREGDDRDSKHRDAKYHEDADRDYRRRVVGYHEDGYRDDRHRDDRYFEDSRRDSRNKEEKNWDDAGRDARRRERKQGDDDDKDKRLRYIKYQDEWLVRDGTNDKFDTKRSGKESDVAEFHKRSSNRDGSPNLDDRSTRYEDGRGKRRESEKEDYDDIRTRSIKEQHLDIQKKSASARVESIGNRGRPNVRDADMVMSPNHGRRGNSPSYRLLKQEESRYREYTHGGKERRDVTLGKEHAGVSGVSEKVSRLNEKSFHRDNGHGDDASTERRPKEDALISPFQTVDKSPSSASNDRRNLNRADVRCSLDVEDPGQRTGGSKEMKDSYGRDNRGNRQLPIEILTGNEVSQPDADNFSVSSPFSKPSPFNNNNRSLLPPTPFRGGPDRPFDDEYRNKPNRRRRMDPNRGRNQGNAWTGVPNWPSPVANGFVPFQHGPPLGFHPVIPQFPTTPMFGVRPSLELNQSGVPFHSHDGDRFPGHVRPFGWDGNNPIFGDESHIYGRLDWDPGRSLNSGRSWETSRDMWKGQNTSVSAEISTVPHTQGFLAHGPGDEDWQGKSAPSALADKKQPNVQVENVDTDHPIDVVESDIAEAPKAIAEDISDSKMGDDYYFSHAYLSMLDISEDLCEYELYGKCINLVGMDQDANPAEDDAKLLIMEDDIDALGKDPKKTSSVSMFCTMDDSVFQRAMSLYNKLKKGPKTRGQDKVPSPCAEKESALPFVPIEVASNDEPPPMEVIPTLRQKEVEIAVPDLRKVKVETSPGITSDKIDEQVMTDGGVKSNEPIAALNDVKEETVHNIAKDVSLSVKEVITDSTDNNSNVGQNSNDGKFVPLPVSGASPDIGNEGVIESGSVNLSRIHQSPESTH